MDAWCFVRTCASCPLAECLDTNRFATSCGSIRCRRNVSQLPCSYNQLLCVWCIRRASVDGRYGHYSGLLGYCLLCRSRASHHLVRRGLRRLHRPLARERVRGHEGLRARGRGARLRCELGAAACGRAGGACAPVDGGVGGAARGVPGRPEERADVAPYNLFAGRPRKYGRSTHFGDGALDKMSFACWPCPPSPRNSGRPLDSDLPSQVLGSHRRPFHRRQGPQRDCQDGSDNMPQSDLFPGPCCIAATAQDCAGLAACERP
mmetsp:Transcript_4482/g.13416  ORF Transcript_4482/g.13416 Transcript_4482/m.13416 type:complete len:262 (+) Transcript_4482:814-1599(+)